MVALGHCADTANMHWEPNTAAEIKPVVVMRCGRRHALEGLGWIQGMLLPRLGKLVGTSVRARASSKNTG